MTAENSGMPSRTAPGDHSVAPDAGALQAPGRPDVGELVADDEPSGGDGE